MSYELRIWDPSRHAPMPTSAREGVEIMERLTGAADTRNSTLEKFGAWLVQRYQAEPLEIQDQGVAAFWGSDPQKTTTACRTAVYHLSLPSEACTKQMCLAVDAAAALGLVVVDDENGMCFLPDGTVFPEDMREMWESTVADVKAGPPDPNRTVPDNRTLLQTIAGELFDVIGRDNKRRS
ncbi:MAG: hypothetical protein ABI652_01890 [Acidobacteriota bacterium]